MWDNKITHDGHYALFYIFLFFYSNTQLLTYLETGIF